MPLPHTASCTVPHPPEPLLSNHPTGPHGLCQAGDALLIPEGWWHQVDSDPATLAVNFWWASQPAAPALPAPYVLRRTLQVEPLPVLAA